ncbi:MAG TPA: S-methyl-5-thioribose-1-phosphate isomerase [Firmicutes bacterium]|nr:S-methyl-5-thioribose-1-phosphate isomerase [Bacillota bacterium]
MIHLNHIQWKGDSLVLLDQTLLPNETVYQEFKTAEGIWEAIKVMKVRGAPAIGIAAAYGLYLGLKDVPDHSSLERFYQVLEEKSGYLATSRPTAVNLFWALDRMKRTAAAYKNLTVPEIKKKLLAEAIAIHKEDGEINKKIGENLLSLLKDGMGLLTHCNAGALATSRYGTATAPMYLAKQRGWHFKVYVDETRPRLQGSALTAFELQQAGIDVTVITDNMAAVVMSQGKIDAVIVGCDCVAANGDVANKIGTLGLSILAKYYRIPFYVAAPISTIDLKTKTGEDIPIEERDSWEVTHRFGVPTAPQNVHIYNPSFDVTPHQNITAMVTEKGAVFPPYAQNLNKLFLL